MSVQKRPAGPRPAVGDRLQVQIEKLAIGGAGIARHDGFVLFVPETAPNEAVEVEVTRLHQNHAEAKLLKILKPGAGRREAPCRFAGECGGCNWQHLTELAQQTEKQKLLLETLQKFLPNTEIPLRPLVPSPQSLRYRNRVQPLRENEKLGFRRRKSHDFLPVDDCLLAEEPLAKYFQSVPAGPDGERVELRLDINGQTSATTENEEDGFAFSQVNRFQNAQLIETTLRWLKDSTPSEIWDLYCGSGNFTFPISETFPKVPVTGVELSSTLVRRARELAKSRGPQFFLSDVDAWLRRRSPPKNSLVIIDPPRAGVGREGMAAIAASEASSLVYIACHPVSLARDLSYVMASPRRRWKLVSVQGFEMFPQTDHMETLAHLVVDSN